MDEKNYYFQLRYYDKNGVVFFEGEYGDCLYDIQKGSVGVFINYGKHGQKMVAQLDQGSYFGELAIIEACPRTATIVALEDNTILQLIRAEDFGRYAEVNPRKVMKMMMSMGMRAQDNARKYKEACAVIGEVLDYKKKRKPMGRDFLLKLETYASDAE